MPPIIQPPRSGLLIYLRNVWQRFNLGRFVGALVLTGTALAAGITGFMWIEKFSFLDALYMTMITVSTVGYQEVHPLSDAGRLFVSVYIFFNLLILAYLLSVLSTYIFDGGLRTMFAMLKNDQQIRQYSGHVIVCGFGRNGRKAYLELRASGADVVVVEQNEAVFSAAAAEDAFGPITVVRGDATLDESLQAAGIERARALITALPKDADNVFVTLTARELAPQITIVARASLKSSETKLLRAGANSVVMPDEIGGSHMANLIMRPEVIRFLDMLSGLGPHRLRLEEMRAEELRPELRGQSIRQLDVRSRTGSTVIGLRHQSGEFTISPPADLVPGTGDVLLFLGTEEQILKLLDTFREV
ncbi:potassium channel family protein [Hymenobacter psychrophilus]|uniref:Voltage-gated potassium channel n=1 Tax=Hymenobacter psychrophilus TaxID=651662 RepID=A0A1H3CX18_9BACT|nr:potassium channel protein [Hymenobacter psychrophilus]SDX58438.1 voltage-gated potassium channel [Hymenobacter psychrophilus]